MPGPVAMRRPLRELCLAAALLAGVALADDSTLPPEQQSGEIRYLSGGIGENQSQAIKAAAGQYALWLSFIARVDGKDGYSVPEQLTILKADGAPVLDLKPDGPFLLIELPPGKYRISAGSAAHSNTQSIQIRRGAHQKLVFQIPEE
jgi:hypothetical protein